LACQAAYRLVFERRSMAMTPDKFTSVFNQAMEIVKEVLRKKACEMIQNHHNGFFLAEKVVQSYGAAGIPDTATPVDIANAAYAAILRDVNYTVEHGLKETNIQWKTLPAKLISHYERLGLQVVPEARKNSIAEADKPLTLENVEAYVANMPAADPRHALAHNFLNQARNKEAALKIVLEFLTIRNFHEAKRYLELYKPENGTNWSAGHTTDRRSRQQREQM
jgi:hypothetical protein